MNIINELTESNLKFKIIEEDEDLTIVLLENIEIVFTVNCNYAIFYENNYLGTIGNEDVIKLIQKLKVKGGDEK